MTSAPKKLQLVIVVCLRKKIPKWLNNVIETDFNRVANTQRCIHVFNQRHCSLCPIQYRGLEHKIQAIPNTKSYQEAIEDLENEMAAIFFFGVTL